MTHWPLTLRQPEVEDYGVGRGFLQAAERAEAVSDTFNPQAHRLQVDGDGLGEPGFFFDQQDRAGGGRRGQFWSF
jgi:hypothetical protein